MVKRGFLAKKKGKKTKKTKKEKRKNKVKMSKLKQADDIEAQQNTSDSEEDTDE